MADLRSTSDRDRYKEDILDMNENNEGEATDNGIADDIVVNNDDDQKECNDQNSDKDYMEKQGEIDCLGKSFFLDKTRSLTLVTPENALLDILEDIKPKTVTSDTGKKLT